MPAKRRPTGKTIDVDHIISVGRDRKTGIRLARRSSLLYYENS